MVVGTPGLHGARAGARGHGRDTGGRSVFAGLRFYECLTGQPPFVAEHVAAVLVRIRFEEPTPAGELRPELPPAVTALWRACWPKIRCSGQLMPGLCVEISALGDQPEPGTRGHAVQPARPHRDVGKSGAEPAGVWSWPRRPSKSQAWGDAAAEQELLSVLIVRRFGWLQALSVSADFLASGACGGDGAGQRQRDGLTQAARAALFIKAASALVTMATGRGALYAAEPPSARSWIRQRIAQPGSPAAKREVGMPGVWIDSLSAAAGWSLPGRRRARAGRLLHEIRDDDASRLLLGRLTLRDATAS